MQGFLKQCPHGLVVRYLLWVATSLQVILGSNPGGGRLFCLSHLGFLMQILALEVDTDCHSRTGITVLIFLSYVAPYLHLETSTLGIRRRHLALDPHDHQEAAGPAMQ